MDASIRSKRPRKRAVEACTFCRRRKIKCNNEQPACANCRTYGKDCVYEPINEPSQSPTKPQRSRPSRRCRDEPRRRLSPKPPADQSTGPDICSLTGNEEDQSGLASAVAIPDGNQQEGSLPRDAGSLTTTPVSRLVLSANGLPSYHGRTSALFEENPQERQHGDPRPRMSDEWIEKGLVAEAAKQRQLEELNFRSGKLDFDSVDPDMGMHLLSLHWNRQHHSFLITYRPAFMRDMACGGPYFSKLLLNAIYFGSAKFSPRLEVRKDPNDPRTAGWKFRERVRELLGGSLDRSDITTIQALLVMTNSLFALGDERNAAWLYSGLAFRMIIDLGMHIDVASAAGVRRFSDEDIEIRRRVFWGAFVVDKIQSLYQGRPASLRESDALVPMDFFDTYEEFEYWAPFAHPNQPKRYYGSPAYSVSTFKHLCKLSVAMADILSNIYTERSFNGSPSELSSMLQSLHSKLLGWKKALPQHLLVDASTEERLCPPPHVLSLHAMFHVLIILLHRPFVADGHLFNIARSVAVNSFIECASAASDIVSLLRTYDGAFSVRRAPYLISYATYVAATIHARIASKRENASEAHRSLETCLAVFRENQETNWAVRKANLVIRNLMKRLGVSIAGPDEELNIHVEKTSTNAVPSADSTTPFASRAGQGTATSREDLPSESPSNDWLHIDEIIQSFVRAAGEQYGQSNPTSQRQGLPTLQQNDSLVQGPGESGLLRAQPLQYGSELMPQDYYASQMPTWQDPDTAMTVEPASVDDLLFGFNALESFQPLNWQSM